MLTVMEKYNWNNRRGGPLDRLAVLSLDCCSCFGKRYQEEEMVLLFRAAMRVSFARSDMEAGHEYGLALVYDWKLEHSYFRAGTLAVFAHRV